MRFVLSSSVDEPNISCNYDNIFPPNLDLCYAPSQVPSSPSLHFWIFFTGKKELTTEHVCEDKPVVQACA